MSKIPEFVYRRDMALIEEYKLRYPVNSAFIQDSTYDAFARSVAEDSKDPGEWRCYFFRDDGEELLAMLAPLDLRAVVGIRDIEGEHDHQNGEEEEILVYGIRGSGFAFRSGICIETFGFLMSHYAAANATDYGFLRDALEPEDLDASIKDWIETARQDARKSSL